MSSHRESRDGPMTDGIWLSKWEPADKSQSFILFTCLEAFVNRLFFTKLGMTVPPDNKEVFQVLHNQFRGLQFCRVFKICLFLVTSLVAINNDQRTYEIIKLVSNCTDIIYRQLVTYNSQQKSSKLKYHNDCLLMENIPKTTDAA